MDLLIMEAAHRRIGAAIGAAAPEIRIITLDDSGAFSVDGETVDPEEVQPALAWMSLDVYRTPNPRIFNRAILRSDSLRWVHTQAAGLDPPIFRMLAHKGVRRKPAGDAYADRVVATDGLVEELPHADVVLLACSLNERTRNLVDTNFLEAMKARSILVNIGRGGLVVEADVLTALDEGKPEHALLDVFVDEPLPGESPLWDHPRVLVAGHGSWFGDGMLQRGDELFLHNLRCYVAGKALRKEVDMGELGRG